MKRLLLSGLLCAVAACSKPPTQEQVTAGVQGAVAALGCYRDASGAVQALPPRWEDRAGAAAAVALTDSACQAAIAAAAKAVPAK